MFAPLEIMVDTACRCPKKRWIQLLKWSNSTTLDVCTLINKDGTRKVYHFADVSKMYIPLEIRAVQRKIGIYKNN